MNIFSWAHNKYLRYVLKRYPIPTELWERVTRKLPLLQHLNAAEKAHLRVLCTIFIHKKTFTTVDDLELNDEMMLIIAVQACLLVLKLGLDYYNGWIEIIIYPGAFLVNQDSANEIGVTTSQTHSLSGESWLRGPVILSWHDAYHDFHSPHPGHNVVVHEFSHKLDMLNGRANGMPPLHPSMQLEQWTDALSTAYETLLDNIEHHHHVYINQYAATNPAEFFAVISEYFFTAPVILKRHCPQVFHQLVSFYRQNPLKQYHKYP